MNGHSPSSARRQRGAVLIVALVMLLLLTMIGLSSMRGTSLQEAMAGNLRDGNLALQAAEAALRKGEDVTVTKFEENTLGTLDAAAQTGTYANFPDVASVPAYRISLLAKLRTSTEAGVSVDGEGAIVRVESDGYGVSMNADNSAASHSQLRSTYLVEQ